MSVQTKNLKLYVVMCAYISLKVQRYMMVCIIVVVLYYSLIALTFKSTHMWPELLVHDYQAVWATRHSQRSWNANMQLLEIIDIFCI